MWEIEYTNEFGAWWEELSESQQDAIAASIGLLEELGPNLGRPHADHIKASKYTNMKELRTQVGGEPFRTFSFSTPAERPYYYLAGTKVVMIGSTNA